MGGFESTPLVVEHRVVDEREEESAKTESTVSILPEFDDEKTKLAWSMLSGFGNDIVNEDEAVRMLEERVEVGDAEAMWMLGICKEYGRGTSQDIKGAEDLYEKSDLAGNEVGHDLVWKKTLGRGNGIMKIHSLQNKTRKINSSRTMISMSYY